MKKLLSFFVPLICLAILFFPSSSHSNSSGSIGGKTGSPADAGSCTQCHYAGVNSDATITTNIPSSGYIPGNIYTITTNVIQLGVNTFGFEITAEEDAGSTKTGTFLLTNSAETQLTNSNTAITHKLGGTSGINSKSWAMDWVAPSSGTGNITFYGSYIAGNGNGNNSGDTYHSATLSIGEAQATPCNLTGGSVNIDHNNAPWMMNATVNGMSMYSYSWTDTNGVVMGSANQTPFYTQWCVTITDNITGCDTTICQDCIADSMALCACPMIYMPVCGCDGVMYANYCIADCADVPWMPALSNGMPGGFLPCSSWVPTIGQNFCGVEISGDSIICSSNNPQILTASPNAAATLPVTYQWYGNGMSSNSNILTINAPGTYCVAQIDANGCVDSACITVKVQDIPIYTAPSPPIICLGDSIVLEIDTLGLSNVIWVPNTLLTPPVHRIVDFPIFSQIYVVEAIDSAGCDRRGEVFVLVDSCNNGPCAIPFLYVDHDTSTNMLEASQFSTNFSYQWSNGDTAHYTSYYPNWCLYVVDLNGCDTTICDITTSFSENLSSNIKIYPNPASEEFFISTNSLDVYNIEIFDVLGKLMVSKENFNNLIAIKTTGFSEGTYFIRIQTHSDIQSYRIVIDR